MIENCKTCGIFAGTHACNPIDINMKNMRLIIQNQQAEITRLNAIIKENESDAKRYRLIKLDETVQGVIYNRLDSREIDDYIDGILAMRVKGE